MGAGENALFEIFAAIFASPEGVLLVIDEIELGLHEEAQTKFMHELKKVCKERHVQIVCTTHSMNILRNVPPEARFFVERISNHTILTQGISPTFAGGKLSGENSNELDIFVEDGLAKEIVRSFLGQEIRIRVNLISIGSSVAVARQLAARYKNIKKGECLGIIDGDKSSKFSEHYKPFRQSIENTKDENKTREWFSRRLMALPGGTWPESWILDQVKETMDNQIADLLSITQGRLMEAIEKAKLAEKHGEFYTLSRELGHDTNGDFVCQTLCRHVAMKRSDLFSDIRARVLDLLG